MPSLPPAATPAAGDLWIVNRTKDGVWAMMATAPATPSEGDVRVTTDLPKPAARRLSAPSWRDSRLLIGVLLVLASVVLGALAIGAADNRVGVWAAKADMTAGEAVTEDKLVRVEVQLGDRAGQYLTSSSGLPPNAKVDRTVRKGELIPRSTLIDSGLDTVPVSIHVDPIDLMTLTKGSEVEIYSAEAVSAEDKQAGKKPEYVKFVERATIQDVPQEKSSVIGGPSSAAAVKVLVPRDQVGSIFTKDQGDLPLRLAPVGTPLGATQ